jgi:hypothetical protein
MTHPSDAVEPVMEADDEVEKLNARCIYYDEWLRRYKQATHVLPSIERERDLAHWELEALSNQPDEASEIPLGGLGATFERENDYIFGALPMMQEYDSDRFLAGSALSTAGTASVYEFVTRVGELGTPQASQYSSRYSRRYQELQYAQNRTQEVRQLVSGLGNLQTLERFDRAVNAVSAARLDVGQRTAAAFEARTFLDGVKGDLFELARQWSDENMTWETMAARLAKGGPQGLEAREISHQESRRSSLLNRLSEIGKDRVAGTLTDIENVWTQTLDHIYTVLGLVNLTG